MRDPHDIAIFIDNGDVISDHEKADPQWNQMVGEYFSSRFGGSPPDWETANRHAFSVYIDRYCTEAWGHPEMDYNAFQKRELTNLIATMFKSVGLDVPCSRTLFEIAVSAHEWICERVKADIPGAVEAIHALHESGYRLYTCSGIGSVSLRGYLRAMGIEEVFRRHYGPDLVNCPKEGSLFYRKLFEDSGMDPSESVIVDDKSMVLPAYGSRIPMKIATVSRQ